MRSNTISDLGRNYLRPLPHPAHAPHPVEFEWLVPAEGFHWTGPRNDRKLVPQEAVGPIARYHYQPLREYTGLFRSFAALEADEQRIREFADEHGSLLREDDDESLDLWRNEISAMSFTVSLWDAFRAGDSAGKRRLLGARTEPIAGITPDMLPGYAETPLPLIVQIIDRSKRGRIETKMVLSPNLEAAHHAINPLNSLGAMWCQLAETVVQRKSFKICAQCGKPFEISRDPKTGKRPEARFDKDSCRVNYYRARVAQARRLHEEGTDLKEIARQLNTNSAQVRKWTKGIRGAAG
jgi:hypothetical protein